MRAEKVAALRLPSGAVASRGKRTKLPSRDPSDSVPAESISDGELVPATAEEGDEAFLRPMPAD